MVEPKWCSNSGFLDKAGKCRNPDGCACAAIAQLERDLAEARAEIERWAEQALKEEDCRKMWQAERDRLAAEVEKLSALLGDFVGHDLTYDGGRIVVPIGNLSSAMALVRRARASLQTGEKGE